MGCIAMIDLDFDAITSLEQLETVPNALSLQISTNIQSMSASLDSLTKSGSSNCDVFGTMSALVTSSAKDIMNSASRGVQEATGKITVAIGGIVNSLQSIASTVKGKLDELIKRAKAIFSIEINPAILSKIKSALNSIKSKFNAIKGAIDGAVANIESTIQNVLKSFANALTDIKGRLCSVMNDAIKAIPSGTSGALDSAKAVANSSVADAKNVAMSGVGSIMQSANATLDSALASIGAVSTDGVSSSLSELDGLLK